MNIFYLDEDPLICATYHCDKHICKMVIEYVQLLSTAIHMTEKSDNEYLYKPTHENHPCSVWVRQSYANWNWLHSLATYVGFEYTNRYKKLHKSWQRLVLFPRPNNLPMIDFTEPPKCMPDEYKVDSVVESYRSYYIKDKSKFAKWKLGNVPCWFTGAYYDSNMRNFKKE